MGSLKGLSRVGGFSLIQLALLLFLLSFFFMRVDSRLQDAEVVFDRTIERLFTEYPDVVLESLKQDDEMALLVAECEASGDCKLELSDPMLAGYINGAREGFISQLEPSPLEAYSRLVLFIFFLSILLFLLGGVLLLVGMDYRWLSFFERVTGQVGFTFLFFFVCMFFLLSFFEVREVVSLLQSILAGAPEILSYFLAIFLLELLTPVLLFFYWLCLIVGALFMLVWAGLMVYSYVQRKKSQPKHVS